MLTQILPISKFDSVIEDTDRSASASTAAASHIARPVNVRR